MEIQYNATGRCFELVCPDGERPALTGYTTWDEAVAARDEMESD